mmetsp:Transcript_61294/g.182576  ORF Transcript_61294/g.182576 Transcript_61294/m.182576 type:complete len:171 (-) Transcript_61294:32-544(-)
MAGHCQEYIRGARCGLSLWCVCLYLLRLSEVGKIGLRGVAWSLAHALLGSVVLAVCVEPEDLESIPLICRLNGLLRWGKALIERVLGKWMARPRYHGLLSFYLGCISLPRAFKDRVDNFVDDIWVGYVFLSFFTFIAAIMAWTCGKFCACLCSCRSAGKKEAEEATKKED